MMLALQPSPVKAIARSNGGALVRVASPVRTLVRVVAGPQGAPGGVGGGVVDEILMRADDGSVHRLVVTVDQETYSAVVKQEPVTP